MASAYTLHTNYTGCSFYTRSYHILQRDGHAIRRSQLLQDNQRPAREEELHHVEQATPDDGRPCRLG